eukprot:g14823.t1
MTKSGHGREEEKDADDIYDGSSDDDDSSSSSGSGPESDTTSGGSSSSDSLSSSSDSGSGSESSEDSDYGDGGDRSEDENFELSFWESLKAVLPWTEAGKEADYAEERLDALDEFQEELDEALRIRKMVETGLHETALERLMASTEGQMYHHFHKHRYELEQAGEWSFVPPSVKRRWRHADKKTEKVEQLRNYMAMRRDRFLRIRGLCRQIRTARGRSSDLVVTVVPESLIDESLLEVAGGAMKHKPATMYDGTRLKKCHWQGTNSKGEQCTCTNYRMEHPHRVFKDDLGVLIHDTLATCGWHATHCVSNTHGDDPVVISTANEGALCNECLVQLTKGPIRNTTAFEAPGVRFKNKRAGTADNDPGGGGEEFLAWNKWFTKGPGRARKRAIRPRHPQAPSALPPAGLRPAAEYVPPPPPPPVFSMANLRRQKKLAKWRLRKEEKGSWAATAIQKTHLRAMMALERPLRAQLRVESAIVMQSLVRRFLARTLVRQIAAFRSVNATAIQRMARGMQARALFRRKRAQAMVQRQMLFFITRAFVASAKVARKIREEMRKKHAVALSFQRAWRGKKGREKASALRKIVLRKQGAAIATQKAWRCYLARRELEARRTAHEKQVRAAILVQSAMRMFIDKRRAGRWRQQLDAVARAVQPHIRGMLARRLACRERALLEQVWGWLGTDSATANERYSRFLPKNTYSVSDEGLGHGQSFAAFSAGEAACKGAEDGRGSRKYPGLGSVLSFDGIGLEPLPGEKHFTENFDKDRTGTCSKVEFKIGLESFLHEAGYPLQKEEANLIVKRYFDGDGFCAWHSFLHSYYHAGSKEGACARHGRLLCTLCIRHGQCQKAGCACTKAKAGRSKQLGFKMCECGHVFDAHALVVGGSKQPKRQRGWVLPQKQLNSLFSKGISKSTVDRPLNVEGCSAASNLRAGNRDTRPGGVRRSESTPRAVTNNRAQKPGKMGKDRRPKQHGGKGEGGDGDYGDGDYGDGKALPLSNRELSPTFLGDSGRGTAAFSPPPGSRQDDMGIHLNLKENNNAGVHAVVIAPRFPEGVRQGSGNGPSSPPKRITGTSLPTMREARETEKERRDASWEGRRGQAKRAALAEMTSAVQGRNAADYAARLQDDIATNTSMVDGRLCLAPVMSKRELRTGFAISSAVTTDPVGLYLYLLKSFSDERQELLEDDRRFTDFVARHAVFLERHWCKLVKDIRNGATDPHLPITDAKRMRVEGLMIPNKKRAQRLDDRLRELGFHARASGIYKAPAAVPVATSPETAAAGRTKSTSPAGKGDEPETGDKRGGGAGVSATSSRPLTQEEKQESMAKMVEACKKKRPGTAGGASGAERRRKRRTVTAGEMESTIRLLKSRGDSRARSPSTGAAQAIPTAEEASRMAYSLLTAASANAAGTVEAPSGRGVLKHVCLHPGCGKVFHLKASAARHQEKEHRFRRRLAAPTPLTDQFMSPTWPKDGVPWVPGSQPQSKPSGSLTADTTAAAAVAVAARRGKKTALARPPPGRTRKRTASPGRRTCTSTGIGNNPTTASGAAVLGCDESDFHARFACGVPGCGERFPEARLLALHLRMGHNDFDLERMKAAKDGTEHTYTLDGVSMTAPIDVGGHVRASFLGAYRLVPPFQPPIGCPAISSCAQHSRLKHGCRRCQHIEEQAAAAETASLTPCGTRLPLGAPLPPAKFYSRAMVVVSHHGRQIKLDLDCSETLRCPLLFFPRHVVDHEAHPRLAQCRTEGGLKDDHRHVDAVKRAPESVIGQPTADYDDDDDRDGRRHQQDGDQTTNRDEPMTPRAENDVPDRSASGAVGLNVGADRDGDGGISTPDDDGHHLGEVSDSDTARKGGSRPSTGGVVGTRTAANTYSENRDVNADIVGRNYHHHHLHHHQERSQPHPHHQPLGGLSPVQLVGVLVDGSGKGWMAARRLWSVGEVGFEALSEAGLSPGDVDVDQEFLVGTEVDYLPLSLVRDTCAVKVDRKDDVHSKQRLGDLPKPLRYVSHGIDSATGAVLLESELRRREERVLGLGGGIS